MGLDALLLNGVVLGLLAASLYLGLRAVRALEHRKASTAELASLTQRLEQAERVAAELTAATAALAERHATTERKLLNRIASEPAPRRPEVEA
jgi:hypothetical protein